MLAGIPGIDLFSDLQIGEMLETGKPESHTDKKEIVTMSICEIKKGAEDANR